MRQALLTIAVDRRRDPSGSRLRALLEAQFAYERARQARRRWLSWLAVAVILTFLGASGLLGGATSSLLWARAALPAMDVVLLLRTGVACGLEWRLQHRWASALAEHGLQSPT